MYLPSKPKFRYTAILILAALLIVIPFKHTLRALLISFPNSINTTSRDNQKKLKDLEKENLALKLKIGKFSRLKKENETLRKAFNFEENKGFNLLGVDVVLFSPSNWRRALEVNAGKDSGVKNGAYVIDEDGNLVGKVTETDKKTSQVTLVNDPEFNLSVFIGEKSFGLLKGSLSGAKILYVENSAHIVFGDKIWLKNSSLSVPIEVGIVQRARKNPNDLFWNIDVDLSLEKSFFDKLFIIR